MASFETKVSKLIHKQLLDCLENLVLATQGPAADTKASPLQPTRPAGQANARPARQKDRDDQYGSSSLNFRQFCFVESKAMRDTFVNVGVVKPSVLVQLRTAYAKVVTIAELQHLDVGPEFEDLDSLLSLYKRDGSLRVTAARLYYVGHLMDGLRLEINSKAKFLSDPTYVTDHGTDFEATVEKIYETAQQIAALIEIGDWCDCDKVNEVLKELRALLCTLQESYQHLLCLQDVIIDWPGFQPVLEASLRSWIGSLGAFIAEVWITFRGIKCYDECECHCDDLNEAWINIQEQTVLLRDRLGQRCDEQIPPGNQQFISAATRLVSIAEKGVKLSSGRHCCEIGCKDRASHRELAESLQESAQCLQIEIGSLCKPFATNAFDLIWPEITTILFCVDPCEEEPDECDALRQNLKCMIESWKFVSERADKAKLRPNTANVTCCDNHKIERCCGHHEVEYCCPDREIGQGRSDRCSVTATEIREEIAKAEKLKVDAPTGRRAGIDLSLKKLNAAMNYQGSAIGDQLVSQARAALGSIEAAAKLGRQYKETAPTCGAIASVNAA